MSSDTFWVLVVVGLVVYLLHTEFKQNRKNNHNRNMKRISTRRRKTDEVWDKQF